MKHYFLFLLLACTMIGCSSKHTSNTTIIWIEDKPGPSMQGTNIFPTVPDSLWDALGLKDGIPSSMSCFLMQTGGKNILFDAGMGAPFSQLMPRLTELGLTEDDIDYVYVTHMHGDHIGGLLRDGEAAFCHAELYVNRLEAEAWLAMSNGRGKQAEAVLQAYSGRVHLFEAGEVLPEGVKTIAAYGHTPGHTCYEKDSVLIIADILHGAALQLSHPEYCPFYDMDAAQATESRMRILDYGRSHHLKMYGHHLPSPGYINTTNMDLNQFTWTREPKACVITDGRIEITTNPHTDLWQRTYYHFRNDNAPVLQMETSEKFFSFIVRTDFSGSHTRFDQCGVVMYLDSDNWLKGSVEYENAEFQHLGSVATNHGYSDWATTAIPADVRVMWYRLSRREDDFCIECSTDGVVWSQMRVCHMYAAQDKIRFGIYACSPEESSFTAVFTDMQLTECAWKAHDGQQPDEE